MRRFLVCIFSCLALAAPGGFALAAVPAQSAGNERVVNVYNWSDYVAPDTIQKFEATTGIKVNYDVYDSNEVLEAKLLAGHSGYDVVFPSSSPFMAQQLKAGVYRELDLSKLPNYSGIDKAVLRKLEASDPGNRHAVPYLMAATGIGYNIDMIRKILPNAPLDSWAMLFDPVVSARLKACGITLLDTPTEAIPAALAYLGRNPISQKRDDLDAAAMVLQRIRGNIKYIHSSSYINGLANGDICLAMGYVGDLAQARARANEAGKGTRIGISIPEQGAVVNIDVMAIPKDAPHPEAALAFINFMMRPDIMAAVTNTTGYANAIPASKAHVKPAIQNDPAIYPPQAVLDKESTVPAAKRDYERMRTRVWTKFKTGY
jgi:putrescine transport system substrate-binding protein